MKRWPLGRVSPRQGRYNKLIGAALIYALYFTLLQTGRDAVAEYGIDRSFFDPAGKINGAVAEPGDAQNRSYAAHLARLGEGSSGGLDAYREASEGSP